MTKSRRRAGTRARVETQTFVLDGVRFALVPIPDAAPDLPLSGAERDVALLAAAGARTREIAAKRGVSQRTVENQLASVYRKLGVSSRTELLVALRRGPRD